MTLLLRVREKENNQTLGRGGEWRMGLEGLDIIFLKTAKRVVGVLRYPQMEEHGLQSLKLHNMLGVPWS